jgi:hypothetical protein
MRTLFTLCLLLIAAAILNAQWIKVNGPSGAGLGCLAADTLGHVYAASDSQWFRSTDDGATWATMPFSTPQWAGGKFCIDRSNILFAGTWHGVARSTNSGTTWGSFGLVDTSISALYVGPDGTVYAGTAPALPPNTWRAGVSRSTNNGASWVHCSPFWAPFTVEAIAVTPQGTMFVSMTSHITFDATIVRSIDAGATWDTVYQCGGDTIIYALAAGPDGTLFAGTTSTFSSGPGGKALRSTDNGQTWTSLQGGLQDMAVRSFIFAGSGYMFLSTMGVYASTNNGTTWTSASAGLPQTTVYSLASSGNYLFAGTYKSGVWRIPLSELTAVQDPPHARPAHYVLNQNYPNPFNPSTTIRYGLPQRSHVTLTVFNTLGQAVAVLQEGEKEAGYQEVRFDRGSLASGVYYCRMKAGSFAAVLKLLLLR